MRLDYRSASPGHAVRLRLVLPWCCVLAGLLLGTAACEPRGEATVITIGGTTTANTPGEAQWLGFKRSVEDASEGRIRMRPLIYGQLGSEEQLLSGLRRGRIQFANLSAQVTSTVVPELALIYAPYLFDDQAEADYVYDHYLTDVFRELLAAKDMHLVTWYEIGFHHVYGKQPILTPEDARGVRFRVASSLNARLFAEALGADVIPLGYGEIVSALQTGLISAGENSVSLYARTGIAGEAPHLTMTAHAFGVSVIVSRKQWWDGLPRATRELLTDSFPSIEQSRRAIRAQTQADLRAGEELGITVHRLDAGQRAAWREAEAGVTELLIRALGGRSREIYERILATKAEYRRARESVASAGPGKGLQSASMTSTPVPLSAPRRRSSRARFASSSG